MEYRCKLFLEAQVRDSNCRSKRLFFDGLLPPGKAEVRILRLVGLTKRMSGYYYMNQTVYMPSVRQQEFTVSFFDQSAVESQLTALPPAPFLVPAVLEAVKQHPKYAPLTYVVPGEADLYCSQYLFSYGGIVLTGDSDLLVHQLGESGKVTFFRDMRQQGDELHGKVFCPSKIAQQLALPLSGGMVSLAFEMYMDSHLTLKQHLARAKESTSINESPRLFDEFRKDYQTLVGEIPVGTSAVSILQRADPRISEYMLQFPSIANVAGSTVEQSSHAPTHVFLPFLLDSPTRTRAWDASASVRLLAYSLININVPIAERKTTVNEHTKQADKSQGRSMDLLSIEDSHEACQTLFEEFSQLRARLPDGLAEHYHWAAFAIYQDISFAIANSKSATIKAVRQQVKGGQIGKTSSWDVIQLFAQIQASYYSFRMLKQMLGIVVAINEEQPPAVLQMKQCLETLPSLTELQDLGQMSTMLESLENSKVFEITCDLLGVAVDSAGIPKSKKAKLAKKKKKRAQAAAVQTYTKSNNPFALLEAD